VETNKNKLWPTNLYYEVFNRNFEYIPENAEAAVEYVLNKLKELDKSVVLAHLRDYKTFRIIGSEKGVSKSRAQQIFRKAIIKMRHPSKSKYLTNLAEELKRDEAIQEAEEALSRQLTKSTVLYQFIKPIDQIKLEDLALSVRAYNCLLRSGVKTLADLSKLSTTDLKHIKKLGIKTYGEVLDICEEYGVLLNKLEP